MSLAINEFNLVPGNHKGRIWQTMKENQPPPTYYKNIRLDVIQHLSIPQTGNILEIGGGEFPTLRELSERVRGESWGVDIVQPVQPPHFFLNGSIEDPHIVERIPKEHFDIILMNDVLEHLWDTSGTLQALAKLLKPGGQLAISVPNVRQLRFSATILFRGTFPRRSSGMFDATHRRWFTKTDVVRAVEEAGFRVRLAVNQGRLVPAFLANSIFGELLGLHIIVIVEK